MGQWRTDVTKQQEQYSRGTFENSVQLVNHYDKLIKTLFVIRCFPE